MKTKTDNKNSPGAPLRVICIGGWGSNWTVKSEKVPDAKRYSTFSKQKNTIKALKSNAPLRVLAVGCWGSNWTVKSEKIPRAYKYPRFKNRGKKNYNIKTLSILIDVFLVL